MKKFVSAFALSALLCGPAFAQLDLTGADLKLTEIWAGGLSGSEATSDWFEITNFGTSAATGIAGNMFYDDDSADATKDDQIEGINSIAPGESVVILVSWEDDHGPTAADAVTAFTDQWGPLPGVQIGWVVGGSGLGGDGDAAYIFDGNTAGANAIDVARYNVTAQPESFVSDADGDFLLDPFNAVLEQPAPVFASVGVLGAFASNNNASDGVSVPAVGSPGTVIPEPTSLVLAGLGVALMARRRR